MVDIKYVNNNQLLKTDKKTGFLVFGIHLCNIDAFKEKFVDSFSGSNRIRRKIIFDKFLKFLKKYQQIDIIDKIWINGSYTTLKEDPSDMDIVIHYYRKFYDSEKRNNKSVNDLLKHNQIFDNYECDAFFVPIYPKNNEKYKIIIESYNSWLDWFTSDKEGNKKGIVELVI
jgi:hypothetical protein